MSKFFRWMAPAALLLSLGAARAGAAVITYGFEDRPATSGSLSHPGAASSFSVTVSDLTLTFTRPGSTFDIADTTTFGVGAFPASWGQRVLDPFSGDTSNTPFVVSFSAPATATAFSVGFGDFAGDADTFTLQAYSGVNGTGTLLATATNMVYGTSSLPVVGSVSLTASGIRSIVMIGGSAAFPNSVYYDNLSVTTADVAAVPEPSTLAGASVAALLVLGRFWSRRNRPAC
ncbi:MAG TPA: hypothetical protein VF590_02265 [Isosphaeraceae bacterium]